MMAIVLGNLKYYGMIAWLRTLCQIITYNAQNLLLLHGIVYSVSLLEKCCHLQMKLINLVIFYGTSPQIVN